MAFGRPNGSRNADKPFRAALIRRLGGDLNKKQLDGLVTALVTKAKAGDTAALKEIADRLDGKPPQDTTMTLEDNRDSWDWDRRELVALIHDARAGSARVIEADGRGGEPDTIHRIDFLPVPDE